MHPEGFAILLPRNHVELAHSATLVLPENDRLASQLVNLGLRKAVLSLVASGLISSNDDLMNFFRNTLYWFQTLDRNPSLLVVLEKRSKSAIEWLIEHALLNGTAESLTITPLGKAGAMSGLFPTTIVHFGQLLSKLSHELEMTFEKIAYGLVYAACASDEFCGKRPSRFLPYPNSISYDSLAYWASKSLPVPLDRGNVQLAQCAHAMTLYLEGQAERKISFATKLSSGYVHRSALDVAWVLDGLHKISCAPEVGCSQRASNNISLLARSVRWGAPAEALDVLRIAERHRVPGFGRQGAMALVAQGIATLHDVLTTAKDKLVGLLRHDRRAQALIDAAASTIGHGPSRFLVVHERVATKLGIDGIVKACNEKLGVEYEQAIASLLRIEAAWIVTILDDGIRQNVPDILIQLGGLGVLLECKTCTKSPPLIKKEEAFSVLQKGADFDKAMRRVTLGKPSFDETSKKKAAAAHDITLIDHVVFMEAILRVHTGALSPQDFLRWLGTPGVAELDRVGGKSTIHLT
jgi:helicase